MIPRPKNEQLFLVSIPVSTESTEYRCSVIHGMHEHAILHVRIRNNTAPMKHEIWQRRHGFHLIFLASGQPLPDPGSAWSPHHGSSLVQNQSTTRTGSGTGRPSTCKARRLTSPTNAAAK